MRKKVMLFFWALLLLGLAACDRAGGDLEAQIDKMSSPSTGHSGACTAILLITGVDPGKTTSTPR